MRYSEAASLASALEICPDLIASPSCRQDTSPGKGSTDSVGLRGEGPAGAVGCRKGLGGEGATGAVSLGGEGPTGAVGCGREGATLGGEGSTGTVGCGEREGLMNDLSRLATAAPWSATRRRMASKDGVEHSREGCAGGGRCRVWGTAGTVGCKKEEVVVVELVVYVVVEVVVG